jgi:SEC-C motif
MQTHPVAGELLFRQPVPTENALRPEGQQLHFTHSPLEMKRERNRQLNCRKPLFHFGVLSHDGGDVETLPDSRHEEATGRELIAVLRQLQSEVGRFLAKRHGALRQLYRSSTKQRTARLPTLKPGQNDPCPCGSGKKFKRCCGRDKRGQMARGVTA